MSGDHLVAASFNEIQRIHDSAVTDLKGQYKARISGLEAELQQVSQNLQGSQEKDRPVPILKLETDTGVVMVENQKLIKQQEDTIRFLESELEKERTKSASLAKTIKQQAEDEIEKQRVDYEKYLIDIRYSNEQNKLKLLKKIEDLQAQLQQTQDLNESVYSSLSTHNDKFKTGDTEVFVKTINELNEKLSNEKLALFEVKKGMQFYKIRPI